MVLQIFSSLGRRRPPSPALPPPCSPEVPRENQVAVPRPPYAHQHPRLRLRFVPRRAVCRPLVLAIRHCPQAGQGGRKTESKRFSWMSKKFRLYPLLYPRWIYRPVYFDPSSFVLTNHDKCLLRRQKSSSPRAGRPRETSAAGKCRRPPR